MIVNGASRVEYRLLGPVEVWADGQRLDAGQPRQPAVLAALLVDAGRVVPVETLIGRVWGQTAPDNARATLRTHLSRIRRLMEQAGEDGDSVAALSHISGGYQLQVDRDQIDLHLFRRLAGTTGRTDRTGTPVESLRTALALWRGQPLAGIDGEWADRMRETWGRERVDAATAWARAELAHANPGPVLATLPDLASDNPLVEPLTEVLMRALHAAGRTSDALDLYTRIRTRLAQELGTDPGPELQKLHQALLRGEVEPASPVAPSAPVPRQLPTPPQMFRGRAMELAELDKIDDASTVVITAIDGMAGVGKTALALRAAHQMIDRYPDGQLFIDLRGYTHDVPPTEPGEALDRMLRSLGVSGEQIPADPDERAGLYRSRLADRRVLIVLDNAATEAQVAPLLPGAPGCLVLITSRRRLSGLDHTHTLSLDTLPLPDAITLLRLSVGDARLAGQPPDLVSELVELCGRLPLAIRIAAARLRSHSTWALEHLVERLRDQQHRLVELAAGQRSVTATLDLSYQHLETDVQRAYRLLGLHFGPEVDPYATAALLDATLLEAGQVLEQLLEAHLLQEPVPGRYQFHDLTRAHAASTATRDETEDGGRSALDRLLDYYRHTAAAAMDAIHPYEREQRPQVPPARTPSPTLPDPASALTWLDSELPNLLAAASYATQHGSPAHLLDLSTILHRHLRSRGHFRDAETLHEQALTIARDTGNREAAMDALVDLGHAHRWQGRYERATDHYQQALQLTRVTGNRNAEQAALAGLGHIDLMQGRYESATGHYQRLFDVAHGSGDHPAKLNALVGLGYAHRLHGRYEDATDHFQQALQLARSIGHQAIELDALVGLGVLHLRQGRYEDATDHFQQALRLARSTGDRDSEQSALEGLGDVHRRQGRYEQATDDYQRLLELADESGDRRWHFAAWQGLGRLHHATGHPDAALTHHGRALAIATELDHPDDQARAHDGLAHAHRALHQPEQARTHWQHALDILTRLGVDQPDDDQTTLAAIRTHLAALEHEAGGSQLRDY